MCLLQKKVGWLVEIDANKDVQETLISNEEAVEYGKNFLSLANYTGMKETYYILQENILTINYAYEENSTIVYPDLIKVKVAMDDGKILGLEAKGYLNSHTERKNLEVKISEEEATKSLNNKLEIQNTKMAIIPIKNTEEEVFCYEFQANFENRKFLVYVNAVTGEEEEILLLVENDNGTLTI
jgi:germination protein YpeB